MRKAEEAPQITALVLKFTKESSHLVLLIKSMVKYVLVIDIFLASAMPTGAFQKQKLYIFTYEIPSY
jgi:hypothetical protein